MKKKTLLTMLLIVPFISLAISCMQANNKPTVSLVVWDEIARETDLKPAEFYLYRNGGDQTSDIVVYYQISGTAKNGYDFVLRDNIRLSGITENETSGSGWGTQPQTSLRIKPIYNTLTEENKTVTITLLPNPEYIIDEARKTGTIIIQDSALPLVQFETPSSSAMKASTIKVVLTKPYSKDVKFNYSIRGVVPNERKTVTSSFVIPANVTEKDLILDIVGNDLISGDETVILEIENAENANIGFHNRHFFTLKKDNNEIKSNIIYDKIYGVILGSRGGSSLGAVVEWCGQIEQIEKLYGVFDEFLACNHYNVNWSHPKGSTEDGIERQKCIATAIIEKQDRIKAEDLASVWVRDYDIYKMEYMTQPYDRILTNFLRWGINISDLPNPTIFGGFPYDLGEHIHLTSRVFHPIPAINAGDPNGAIEDTKEIAKLYYNDNDDAIIWGGVYNAAIALAMLPGSSVNSVISGALKFASPEIRKEIEAGLAIADKYSDPMDRGFREEINKMYEDPASPYFVNNRISRYRASSVYENVTCAFAILKLSNGDVPLAVKIANNRARDTDCTAASAGGLAGALTGTSTIPVDWIESLDEGMVNNPYTVSHLSNEATAKYLYRALEKKLTRMSKDPVESVSKKNYLDLMRKSGIEF